VTALARTVERLAYELRGVLVAPPVLAAPFCSWGGSLPALVAWPLGVALFLAGWLARMWAQRHMAYRRRVRMVLATCGPYAYVRNPLYLANILMGLGAVVASEAVWMVPVTVLWYAAVYSLVVRHEEQRLSRHYGEPYRSYRAAVPRWLPRQRQPPACGHGGVGRVVRNELHTPLIMAPAALKALDVLPAAGHLIRGLIA